MLTRPLTTLLGIDPVLLGRCPARERWVAYLVALVALGNCVALGASVAVSLMRLGEAPSIAATIGVACGVWFSVIQRLLVILHGYRQPTWRGVVSRSFCVLFLLLFGFVTALVLGEGLETSWGEWYGVTLTLGKRYGVTSSNLWYGVTFCSFLLPFGLAARLLGAGAYGRERRAQEAAVLEAWRSLFIQRYEGFVRQRYGVSTYRIPAGMVCYDGRLPTPLQRPSHMR